MTITARRSRSAGRQHENLRQAAALMLGTTTSDRTERDQLLHRPGGPRVDVPRRDERHSRQVQEQRPRRAGCLLAARWPAPRASGRPGRRVIEATVSRTVRRSCFIAAGATHRSAGRLLRSQTDSDLRLATHITRACFRTRAVTTWWPIDARARTRAGLDAPVGTHLVSPGVQRIPAALGAGPDRNATAAQLSASPAWQ